MRFINNLKTRTKLLLSFAVILIITAIVGINGLLTANDLHNSQEDFYASRFVPNMLLSEIQINQEQSNTELQRILYKTEAMQDRTVIESSIQALNELIAENDSLLQEYEATDLTPEEKELLTALKTANSNYRTAREELIAAVKNDNFELAVEINDQKARALREEVGDILSRIKVINEKAATELIAADEAKFNSSRNIAVILLIIALLVGLGFTVLLTRVIAGPMKVLVDNAHHMAQGDFTRDVEENLKQRRDEMGVLANAFADMNKNIRAMLIEVSVSVQETSASSQELSATTEEVSAQGESITSSVQQIAAGMEEISAP